MISDLFFFEHYQTPTMRAHTNNRECVEVRKRPAFWAQNIDTNSHWVELQLFILALGTGIQDAVVYPQFGCFVSNQTGNTVVFAVGALSHQGPHPAASTVSLPAIATSLGLFIAGVFSTGQFANSLSAVRRRWWLISTSMFQCALIAIAAALLYQLPDASHASNGLGLLTIVLLAFSSGAQVGMVRALKITDITTAMATAAWIDILIDPKWFAPPSENRGRNRRVGFLLCLVIGSFIGAAAHAELGPGFAVILSLITRLFATAVCLFSPRDVSGEVELINSAPVA